MNCQYIRLIPAMVKQLTRLYADRTEAEHIEGLAWYPLARDIVAQWAKVYSYPPVIVACVTAAISPQLEWTRNLVIADDVLARRTPSIGGVLPKNLEKAIRIRDNRSHLPAGQLMVETFPCGPKVHSFASNLAGDSSMVTVDGHAMQAALDNPESRATLKWVQYACFVQAFQQAADKAKLAPCDFQAIIWHVWRNKYPRAVKREMRKRW